MIRRSRESRAAGSSGLGQWIEAVLLVILAIQVARLLWALVTPVGVFGDWRARQPVVVSADARTALFSGFDPFFRTGGALGGAGGSQVTSLPFRLFGIRLNEASGQGSAIIANEAGVQASYAVGDEIAPGVVLKAVQFDHVIIERGGASEMLYIDQSGDAPVVDAQGEGASQGVLPSGLATGGAPVAASGPSATPAGPVTASAVLKAVSMAPRTANGEVTGIVMNVNDGGEGLSRSGFRAGDIVVQVNGRRVSSMEDLAQFQSAIRPGARVSLMVERGGSTVPVSLILPENQ